MAGDQLGVAVLGPGGVGGLVAALLSRGGAAVCVLAGGSTAHAIDHSGIRVESARFGDFTAAVRTAERLEVPVDAVFIAVKSTHLTAALERLPAGALGDAVIIPLLNGFEHMSLLRSLYPRDSVVAGTMRVESTRLEAGLIRQTSPFATVELAPSAASRERIERLGAALAATGLDVRLRDDESAMLWDKFAMLGPLALLTTHERANVGVVRTRRREDAVAVIAEVAAVAKAEGAAIDPAKIVKMLDSIPETMETSMQKDQAHGRPLELDALGGALIRRAAAAHVAVPVTSRLVKELEARTAARPAREPGTVEP
ncbi:MAG: ketopantoate reductase family protein [Candidatus Dormibacterales bacterium]